jgi:hypothetical protein
MLDNLKNSAFKRKNLNIYRQPFEINLINLKDIEKLLYEPNKNQN